MLITKNYAYAEENWIKWNYIYVACLCRWCLFMLSGFSIVRFGICAELSCTCLMFGYFVLFQSFHSPLFAVVLLISPYLNSWSGYSWYLNAMRVCWLNLRVSYFILWHTRVLCAFCTVALLMHIFAVCYTANLKATGIVLTYGILFCILR